MATHFARGILTEGRLVSARISSACHSEALTLPEHRRTRYLASRALLAELLFMLYGTSELPDIITQPEGRPVFADPDLPRFSIAYAGNIIGVALTPKGIVGWIWNSSARRAASMAVMRMKTIRSRAMRSCGYATRTILSKPEPAHYLAPEHSQALWMRLRRRQPAAAASRLRTSACHSGYAGRGTQRRRGCAHLVHCGYPRHRTHENLGI